MGFDWIRVLDENHIPYITRGSNVKRGNVNLTCPFCGSADSGMHMGVDPVSSWWGCWRNDAHRGKSPVRLLAALLKIPYWKAREIAGLDEDYADPEEFDTAAAKFMGRGKSVETTPAHKTLVFPPYFKHIATVRSMSIWRHRRYLEKRGFYPDDLVQLCEDYSLMATLDETFKDRIILPYYIDGALVTWTARAIADAVIRYKDLSLEESLISPKRTLYNHDALLGGGEALLVVEGPLDVLKLDFYGRGYGVRAVGLSTNSIHPEQIYLLEEAINSFDKIIFMLDNNPTGTGIGDSMRLKSKLSHIPNLRIMQTPYGRKDGGEMSPEEVIRFSKEVTK